MSTPHRLSQQPLVQREGEGSEMSRIPEGETSRLQMASHSAASYPPRPPPHVQQPASRSGAYPPAHAHRDSRSHSPQPRQEGQGGAHPHRGSSTAHRSHSGSGAGQRPSYVGGRPSSSRPAQQYARAEGRGGRGAGGRRRRRRRADENARTIPKWEVGMALGIGAFDAFSDIFFGIDLFDVSRHQYDSLRFFEQQFGVYVGGFVFLLGLIGVVCLCIQVVYGSKDKLKQYMTTKVFIVMLEDVPSLLIASVVARLVLTTSAILALVGSVGSMALALYQVYQNQGRTKKFNLAAGMATLAVIAALMFFFVGRDPSECFIPSDGINSLLNSGMPGDHYAIAFVQKGGFLPAPEDFATVCTQFGAETNASFTKCNEASQAQCVNEVQFDGVYELVDIECTGATETCWGQNFQENWKVTFNIKGQFTWKLFNQNYNYFLEAHPDADPVTNALQLSYVGVNRCHKWDLSFLSDTDSKLIPPLSANATAHVATIGGAPSVSVALGPCHPNENNLDAGCGKWGSEFYVFAPCVGL